MVERINFQKEDVTKEELDSSVSRAREEMKDLRIKIEKSIEDSAHAQALLERSREIILQNFELPKLFPEDKDLKEDFVMLADRYAKFQQIMRFHHHDQKKIEKTLDEFGDDEEFLKEILNANLDS